MNTLLIAINAKYIHTSLSVRCLRSAMRRANLPCQIAEFTINQPVEQIVSAIRESGADLVCFSCYLWNIRTVVDVCADLYLLQPELPMFFGGPEVSFDNGDFLNNPFVTGILRGAGEETLPILATVLSNGKSLSDVPSLVWKENGQRRENLTSCNPVPPAEDFVYDDEELIALKNKVFYYESSRGCPYKCAYCLSGSSRERLCFLNPDVTLAHLQKFLDAGVRQVNFVDRTFNCNTKRTVLIWEYLKTHDNGITQFDFEIGGDLLDDAQMACLDAVRPGQFHLEIGVQSTNPVVLEQVARSQKLDVLRQRVFQLRQRSRVHLHLDLIAGLPGEDIHSFGHSFDDICSMAPHQFQLGFLKLLKGSPLAEKAELLGLVCSKRPPYEVLKTAQLSEFELRQLKQIAFLVEKYSNCGGFETLLADTMAQFDRPFAFYTAFAAYFSVHYGYADAHSRFTLGQALLSFGNLQRNPTEQNRAAFLLLHDLLLRENLRSLPGYLDLPEIRTATGRSASVLYDTMALPDGVDEKNRRSFAKASRIAVYPAKTVVPPAGTEQLFGGDDLLTNNVILLYDYQKRDLQGNATCRQLTGSVAKDSSI